MNQALYPNMNNKTKIKKKKKKKVKFPYPTFGTIQFAKSITLFEHMQYLFHVLSDLGISPMCGYFGVCERPVLK
jgi:hypothetical protein